MQLLSAGALPSWHVSAQLSLGTRSVASTTPLRHPRSRQSWRETAAAASAAAALCGHLQARCRSHSSRCGRLRCRSEGLGQGPEAEEDSTFLAELRKRGEQIREKEQRRDERICRNWQEGQAMVGAVAAADDWVRRVALLGNDLFVGTASTGVRRYRLGEPEPRQRFEVSGDPRTMVPAFHPGEVDPETSVTSLACDGRYLAAGLAGSRAQLWDSDGTLLLDALLSQEPSPCFVCLLEGMLYAVSGQSLRRWRLDCIISLGAEKVIDPQEGEEAEMAKIMLSCCVHCLAPGPGGSIALGFEDGSVELRSRSLSLLSRRVAAHPAAVSAACCTDSGLVTGDAQGRVVSWGFEANSPGESWEIRWRSRHQARVTAINVGGGGSIVTGALDGTLRVWKPDSGQGLFQVPGHKIWFGSICIDDNDGIMVTDGRDNAVYIYDFRQEDGESLSEIDL
ncbi:unnamed protein product [Polarella glacialis]|uniref:Uncharacterized protein n=1 Tax=Polarella glacialis TaxID=89957 RepID=A0A813EX74_POLGL|nr:unnamed protein product [Polarella glacialis]